VLRAIYALLLFILSFSAQSGYEYDATYNLASTEIVEIDRKNCHYDDTSNFCDNGRQRISSYSQKKTQDGSFFAFDVGLVAAKGVTNPVPSNLARVVPGNVNPKTLGRTGDVFVTDANALKGLNSKQIADKLTIPQSSSGFKVIEFPSSNVMTQVK
jgi:hypothetical protein